MKFYKPTTPSRRKMSTVSYRGILTTSTPHKALLWGRKRSVGRNNLGRVTTRHKGAGNKKLFRDVSFNYDKVGIPARIESIEYDPNRNSFIALALYRDGERRYVIATRDMRPGMTFVASPDASLTAGNQLPLRKIPSGTFVYNIELKPNGGGKLVRGAGTFAEVLSNDAGYSQIKMPSTEVRKVPENCWATVGVVGNEEYKLQNFGKAGRSRWRGIRPTVRGTAMNPVDHPYGGGEGRQGRGRRRAISVYGKPTGKGQKSRTPKKYSNYLIVSRRITGKKRKQKA